jgi:hypothetical protein
MQPEYVTLNENDPLTAFLDRVTHNHLHRTGRQDLIDKLQAGARCTVDDGDGDLLIIRIGDEVVWTTGAEALAKALDYVRAQN